MRKRLWSSLFTAASTSATLTGINYTKTMTETKMKIFMTIKGKQSFHIPCFFVRGKKS